MLNHRQPDNRLKNSTHVNIFKMWVLIYDER